MPRKSVKISEISRIYRFLPLSQLDHYYTRRQDNVINIMRPSKRSNLLNFAALIKSLDIHYIEEPIIRQLINVGIDKIWGKRGKIGVVAGGFPGFRGIFSLVLTPDNPVKTAKLLPFLAVIKIVSQKWDLSVNTKTSKLHKLRQYWKKCLKFGTYLSIFPYPPQPAGLFTLGGCIVSTWFLRLLYYILPNTLNNNNSSNNNICIYIRIRMRMRGKKGGVGACWVYRRIMIVRCWFIRHLRPQLFYHSQFRGCVFWCKK